MPPISNRAYALLIARWLLGLMFFMAGWWKVFSLGPLVHARSMFVEPYGATWLPRWLLWSSGTAIPFVELLAGALLLLGWQRRAALLALGAVLVVVTFGHLLAEPLYPFHQHVIPRAALLLFLLWAPAIEDRLSADVWLAARSGR